MSLKWRFEPREIPVKELLRTNNFVYLSFAQAVLKDAGIDVLVFDSHMSVMEGSLGVLPRRLMVADDDLAQAKKVLTEAEPPEPDWESTATTRSMVSWAAVYPSRSPDEDFAPATTRCFWRRPYRRWPALMCWNWDRARESPACASLAALRKFA